MNLFSETYNCYYQIMQSILTNQSAFTLTELQTGISEIGYEESLLYLIPKLKNREWDLLKEKDGVFLSKISKDFYVPLTLLQKAYIKTILQDERIQLFFDADELKHLQDLFEDVPVLWKPGDFYYYDRFSNRDDYENADYQKHFRTLVTAISHNQYVDISYESKTNHRVHHHYLPCRLEYSIKNDKFRLLGIEQSAKNKNRIEILNLDRMREVTLLPAFAKKLPDINKSIRTDYYREPVRLLIHTERNTLERTMLQFANYEKNTRKIDAHTYECLIYYNKKTETELLIEVLSFGPMIEVLGNEPFLQQIKQRLQKQKQLQNAFCSGQYENNNI
ncbi:MAG: WYL domain-containing protein [Lachnospiraceae bacterium]|nr:WYL domain-containing protein [Lachnospiraceae bacterium]